MRITTFGVTGGSGRAFVELALAADHEVTAVARRPEALGVSHPRLNVVKASVTDADALEPVISGADAVVSVLGVSGLLEARKGTTIYSESSRAIIEAMQRQGVSRLVAVSSGGVDPKESDNWFYTNILKRFFLEPIYRDMRIMEANMRASGLDYTIVHPPFLTGDKRRTDYRVTVNEEVPNDTTLSRWSLGHFLLQVVESPDYSRSMASVSY